MIPPRPPRSNSLLATIAAALLLALLPALASAQVITRPLSANQQRVYVECMAAAGQAESATLACLNQAAGDVPVTAPVARDEAPEIQPQDSAPTEPASATAVGMDVVEAAPEAEVPDETVAPPVAIDGEAVAADADAATPPTDGPLASGEAPTQAELDYAALYGGDPYNPVADPTLPDPAVLPSSYDPWENWNRKVHRFNNAVDRGIAKPLAKAYVKAVPRPVRLGVGNFFNNLGQPVNAINALLQGRPKQAGQSLARFAVNSTIGLVGIFDPATRFNIPNRSEDFGQTLGVWGWKKSRYVELPLFGPRTVRDSFGLVGDAPLSPLQHVNDDQTRILLQGTQLVDTRTQLMALDSMREGATDEYALIRDGWMQRRQYQIFGDREQEGEALPDYLQDDADPYIPVDVMPVVPGAPGG